MCVVLGVQCAAKRYIYKIKYKFIFSFFFPLGFFTVASTSMPTTALFFLSYEATKSLLQPKVAPQYAPVVHMFSASVGEVVSIDVI